MAVNVEDRDQTYSFVDVRDVVVLDPDVGCHPGCLLRGAVDAFQQPGWEFSVQVKRSLLFSLAKGRCARMAVVKNLCRS